MSNLVLIVNEFECHMILESPEVGFAKKQMAQSLIPPYLQKEMLTFSFLFFSFLFFFFFVNKVILLIIKKIKQLQLKTPTLAAGLPTGKQTKKTPKTTQHNTNPTLLKRSL